MQKFRFCLQMGLGAFAVCLTWMLFALKAAPVFGALPEAAVPTPGVYTGEYSENGETCRALLYLDAPRGFLLREEIILSNGKISSWDTTGKWHPIRSGRFVQLTNSGDFLRLLNVGGAGDLYLGLRMPAGTQATLILRKREMEPPEHAVTGRLRMAAGKILLENVESGATHSVLPGKAVTEFFRGRPAAKETPSLVRAVVAVAKRDQSPTVLRIRELRGLPENQAANLNQEGGVGLNAGVFDHKGTGDEAPVLTAYFAKAVAGRPWMVTRFGSEAPDSPCFLSFQPDEKGSGGTVEAFDGALHLTGGYALRGRGLSLSIRTGNPRFAQLILQTRTWRLAGEVLELWGDSDILALLETPR